MRRLFPDAMLLAEPGGTSHADSLQGDPCVNRTIAAYLATGALRRRNTHAMWDKTCAPLNQPFASLATANVARAAVAYDHDQVLARRIQKRARPAPSELV